MNARTHCLAVSLFLMVAGTGFAKELVSTSPDGETKILKLPSESEQYDIALASNSNRPQVLFKGLTASKDAEPEIEVEWNLDGNVVEITVMANTNINSTFLVKRIDAKSKLPIWVKPKTPDLRALIASKTKDPSIVYSGQDSNFTAFGPTILPSENQIRLEYTYADVDKDWGVMDKSIKYVLEFTTQDWFHYDLVKITRSGDLPREAILSDTDTNQWAELFPQERMLVNEKNP